jgi:hypothetical protein
MYRCTHCACFKPCTVSNYAYVVYTCRDACTISLLQLYVMQRTQYENPTMIAGLGASEVLVEIQQRTLSPKS